MSRPVLLLMVIFALVPSARAVQLGESREQIIAQYGLPTVGNLDTAQSMGIYRWAGWRLDVEIMQGIAQRLIFTKNTVPVSEAEERQLLNDNGGFAAWQPVEHVATGALADKKWRRTTDGAEAFTIASDGRKMCLVTRFGADIWAQAHAPAVNLPQQLQNSVLNAAVAMNQPARRATAPATSPLAGLIVLAGVVGFIAFLGRAVTRALKKGARRLALSAHPLWSSLQSSRNLRSACTVATPPPPLPVPAARDHFPISNFPKPKTLEDLSWQEFELLVGELYRRQGYTVEMCSGDGSDGGVDLWLRRDGKTVLVQCKHWKVYKVGVSPVRELFGILSAGKADHAIFVTTGKFTPDALAFANGKPMDLLDRAQLLRLMRQCEGGDQGDLLDVARWSADFAQSATIMTPVCPFCRSTMVLRRGKQSGNQFWGCSTYPGCRGKRNVRPELMRA